MKTLPLLLAGSLAANLALFAALRFTSPGAATRDALTASAGLATQPSAAAAAPSRASAATPDASAQRWAALDREDLSTLVPRLQAEGFPPEVIRAIVNVRFMQRRAALAPDGADRPYWKRAEETTRDPKLEAALKQLEQEHGDTLKKFFGPGGGGDDEAEAMRRRQFGDLPVEKIERIGSISQRYGKSISELFSGLQGAPLSADGEEKFRALQKQMHDEIAGALTPAELLEYDLRNSSTAGRLRNALAGFNSTEAEYRALFPLYQAFDAQYPPFFVAPSPEQAAARFAAEQALREQAKALLPPDRVADFEQATRPGAQQLNQLIARLDLPLSAAAQVMTVQQDIQQRAGVIRRNGTLSADDRAAQLAALAAEANTKITAALGARGLEGYRQNGGQWLTQLQPPPNQKAGRARTP
jgi:hypothetical protein